MRFDIVTIFPEAFAGILECGILGRARRSGRLEVRIVNLRDFAKDKHRSVDDRPFGGGEGMVFMPGPIFDAVDHCRTDSPGRMEVVLLSPQGATWRQETAEEFAVLPHVVLICGRYEGVDERVRTGLVTDELSIGDYVLSGGELAAAVIVDAVTRLLPGALGCEVGAAEDSFATGLLEYPQYTRPPLFRGQSIPEILISGDHARVARWRREQALLRTWQRRPDLLEKADLSDADRAFLAGLEADRSNV